MTLRQILARAFAALPLFGAATAPAAPDDGVTNLMVILRESPGRNKQDEALSAVSKVEAVLPDGKQVQLFPAWFEYIGDMHIRFVFDTPTTFRSAETKDLQRLNLSPEQALVLAISNVKARYGSPAATPWNDLMQVNGKSPDLDSSYFLDREFWEALLRQHPEGIVAAVPKRGGLLYTPVSNTKAVTSLKTGVAYLHTSSERTRISSALYIFKDNRWSVFQPASSQ